MRKAFLTLHGKLAAKWDSAAKLEGDERAAAVAISSAKGLAARGHRVSLLVSGWDGAPSRVGIDGMDVHRVGGRHTFGMAAPPYYARHLRRSGFDVVVEDLNKVPLFAPAWVGRPLVLLVHHLFGRTAFEEASLPVAAATWLLERPLAVAYRRVPVAAVSGSTADDLVDRGLDRDRITVIPNGVDLERYRQGLPVLAYRDSRAYRLSKLEDTFANIAKGDVWDYQWEFTVYSNSAFFHNASTIVSTLYAEQFLIRLTKLPMHHMLL